MKLLLIEDNAAMQTTLVRSFGRRGMQVVACSDGARALDRWQAALPDVVLLDLSLPGQDGLQVLSAARAAGLHTPVIILTARGTVGDRILGLNTGADDYLAKPFDLDELEARVRALARRSRGSAIDPAHAGLTGIAGHAGSAGERASTLPAFCGLAVDAASGAVYLHGQALELSTREGALLRALLARPGHAVAKERLSELVFPGGGSDAGVQADAIEVVVYRLRRRLAGTGATIVTLRGLGYLIKAEAGDAPLRAAPARLA